MGWRGVMRSAIAAARASEKAAHQRRKQQLKARLFDETAQAVDEWEAYLERLSSIHHEGCSKINWASLIESTVPSVPARTTGRSDLIKSRLEARRRSIFDFFRGGHARIQNKLKSELTRAENDEQRQYEQDLSKHHSALIEWEADTAVARKIMLGDPEETRNVLSELTSLSDNGLIGKSVKFSISSEILHAMPEVHGIDIIPTFRRKQLASGRLSETKMPVAEVQERYQDYVASAAFRIAVDTLNVIPRPEVHVTCITPMLNPKTGHIEMAPILYVRFVRDTLDMLNLSLLDPSDALSNFIHVMNFKRTKGFSTITAVLPIE